MATNVVFEMPSPLSVAVASTIKSGDPVLIGRMAGVALTDYRSSDGKATIDFDGVFSLSVKGINDGGNVAVAVGDPIYIVPGDTPVLSKKASGVFFGYAMGVVLTGATTTISVRVPGSGGTGGGGTGYFGGGVFISGEITGTGGAQNTAHGLGVVPSRVVAVLTELSGGAYDVAEGSHTATNVVLTVTTNAKYKVMAFV